MDSNREASRKHKLSCLENPSPNFTTITLTTVGHIHGIEAAEFQKEAEAAKDGCPISKALQGNVTLKLNARLDLEHH